LAVVFLLCSSLVLGHSEDYRSLLSMIKKNANPKSFDSNKVGAESNFLKNIVSLTDSGTNAEAYWSFDGKQYSFQAIRGDVGARHPCDAIYTANADGTNNTLISGATGRTTCSYFFPDNDHVLYSSTSNTRWCPPTPDMT